MKSKFLKALLIVAAGYVLIALLRFGSLEIGYGLVGVDEGRQTAAEVDRAFMRPSQDKVILSNARELAAATDQFVMGAGQDKAARSNYASVAYFQNESGRSVEQKYEKVATLATATERYDDDERRVRSILLEHNALIQEEAASGGSRLKWLSLTIGVPPDRFDSVVATLKAVGKPRNFQVTKTDKTNDFLELRAKRATLEKSRDALVALKNQSGKIEELVKVEQEILSLEGKIQNLGVRLGQFDKANEFCTVRFTLAEERPAKPLSRPHLELLLLTLQWTSIFYLGLLGCLFVGLLSVILVITIAEKVFFLSKQMSGSANGA